MATRGDSLPIEKLWQQVNRLSEEVEQVKREVWALVQARRAPLAAPKGEVDDDLRALVGIDPPLSLRQERKELKRIVARRHGAD
ncbi:MAG: hypothetical protein HY314_17485 [Acidobacteria bacterium]|nr:hypothetical protein [Acidobacteriota bacterium]